jgi:hypothetical protein
VGGSNSPRRDVRTVLAETLMIGGDRVTGIAGAPGEAGLRVLGRKRRLDVVSMAALARLLPIKCGSRGSR